MNIALWVAQGLVAFAMLGAGALKVATPRLKLAEEAEVGRVVERRERQVARPRRRVLGGIGLVVPWLTGILPILTPVAAVCLLIIMGGAVKTHRDLKEPPAPAVVLGALCGFIALGRFGVI